jgi:hypothetical protein
MIALNLNLGGWTCELIVQFFCSCNGHCICFVSCSKCLPIHTLCNCIYEEEVMQFMNEKRLNDHLKLFVCAKLTSRRLLVVEKDDMAWCTASRRPAAWVCRNPTCSGGAVTALVVGCVILF